MRGLHLPGRRPRVAPVATALAGLLLAAALPTTVAASAEPAPTVSSPTQITVAESVGPNSVGGDLWVSDADPSHAVVGDRRGPQYWQTRDAGETWESVTGLPVPFSEYVYGWAADPTDGTRQWVVTRGPGPGHLLSSSDDGRTWKVVTNIPAGQASSVHVHSSGTIVFATEEEVYVSTDDGQSWQHTGLTDSRLGEAILVGDSYYVADASGVHAIAGIGGVLQPPRLVLDSGDSVVIPHLGGDGRYLIAGGYTVGVWVSSDSGDTWQRVDYFDHAFTVHAVASIDGELLVIQGTDLHASTDGGDTWSMRAGPLGTSPAFTMKKVGDPGRVVASVPRGGAFALNPSGWERIGVPGVPGYDLEIYRSGFGGVSVAMAGTSQDVYRTVLPVKGEPMSPEWGVAGEGIHGVDVRHVTSSTGADASAPVLYRSITDAHLGTTIEVSKDEGRSWEPVNADSTRERHVGALQTHPSEPDLVVAGMELFDLAPRLLVSRDGGGSWESTVLQSPVTTLAADPFDPDHWYVGTLGGLLVSYDGLRTLEPSTAFPVHRVAVHPGNPKELLAVEQVTGGPDLLHRSFDGGDTFEPVLEADPSVALTDVAFAPDDPSTAFATTSLGGGSPADAGQGLLVSEDSGLGWKSHPASFDDPNLTLLAFDPADPTLLYVGTEFSGFYRLTP